MNKIEIAQVKKYKYLGVTFDSKLNWNIHINNLINSRIIVLLY